MRRANLAGLHPVGHRYWTDGWWRIQLITGTGFVVGRSFSQQQRFRQHRNRKFKTFEYLIFFIVIFLKKGRISFHYSFSISLSLKLILLINSNWTINFKYFNKLWFSLLLFFKIQISEKCKQESTSSFEIENLGNSLASFFMKSSSTSSKDSMSIFKVRISPVVRHLFSNYHDSFNLFFLSKWKPSSFLWYEIEFLFQFLLIFVSFYFWIFHFCIIVF